MDIFRYRLVLQSNENSVEMFVCFFFFLLLTAEPEFIYRQC